MPYLFRVAAAAGFFVGSGQGRWFAATPEAANFTKEPDNQTVWEAWAEWAQDHVEQATAAGEGWYVWASTWTGSARVPARVYPGTAAFAFSWTQSLASLDGRCSGTPGQAWRPGARGPSLGGSLLVSPYPLQSSSCSSGWFEQRSGRTLVYWAQRAAGGVPEATGASFLEPGAGRIPETSDLRNFNKVGSAEKWVLVRREGRVAVFKVGGDSQTIRAAGRAS